MLEPDLWDEPLSAEQAVLIAPFVTNLDRPIFGIRNLPEVVKGALFSRYSRSDRSLRRVLLDEFITRPESGFAQIAGSPGDSHAQLVATRAAEAFYDRVLIGYGDDSVAELGGAHLACEGISNIAAKVIEDARLGIGPLEKSTRYVAFNRKHHGRYRYCRPAEISASPHAGRYEAAMDALFDTYSALLEPVLAWVRTRSPRDQATSERAYQSATRAKAFDLLRGLLPMATLTNVGLFGNGRAFEYLLTRLYAAPLAELQSLAGAMQAELDLLIPSFVKRASSTRGLQHQEYLRGTRQATAALAHTLVPPGAGTEAAAAHLVEYDPDAEHKVVAAILYPHSNRSLAELRALAASLPDEQRRQLIAAYVGERGSRFHKPGRAFEEPYYVFDVLADIGAYRDLHRHRVLTQERQRYTVQHGYVLPVEIEAAGVAETYRAALEQAAAVVAALEVDLPEAAQYAVPLAYRMRWRIKLNLREAYHLIELRSAPQGHPSYRAIAQEMYRQIHAVHPMLAAGMRFVDMSGYALERLAAEQRLDARLSARRL